MVSEKPGLATLRLYEESPALDKFTIIIFKYTCLLYVGLTSGFMTHIFLQAVLKAFHHGSSSAVDVKTAFPLFCDQIIIQKN